MKAFFLRAKHWQSFLLVVGVFVVEDIVALAVMTVNVASTGNVGMAGLVYQLRRDPVRLNKQLESLLEETHVKLSSLVSDLLGVSARC